MRHLLIDNLDPTKTIGWTNDFDKISFNLNIMKPMLQNVNERKGRENKGFAVFGVYDKWLVLYNHNLINPERHLMYFVECTTDIDLLKKYKLGIDDKIDMIKDLQTRYITQYNIDSNTTFLSFVHPNEQILEPNFFVCTDDDFIISKAHHLGVYPLIESHGDGKLKVCFADEMINVDGVLIQNVYAIINFGKAGENETAEEGYIYLKIYDFIRNHDKIIELEKAIIGLGAKFDRAYFSKRFSIEDLN
ncbi:hypothetical protein SAMN05444671_1997 [Flavobacterium sp. CF108]|uniref:hypothetical protein n=1 Tax=unclassified Flavobacterium TaxID=196869 RepID=UPI0008CBADD1|nr:MULTISPECIES: hypothetical protein [unclassified Flavobacterium]SEN63921.1 hypothetical protein SAMN04487978_1313 [Flavobacterium sp. fv08]SHH05354.1 hypothetical protein SAMN05444671_1997 [Flavobacterium sp. CF108]